jgi:diguanylate cyclase (GGDEF)-like protein
MGDVAGQPIAVMIILLNNLRAVQEASGVAAADQIVGQAARRVQLGVGPGRQVARFGDATFAVLFKGVESGELLEAARAVHHAIVQESYQAGDGTVLVRASIGISVGHDSLRDTAALVQQADMACRLARESGNDPICLQHFKDDSEVAEHFQRQLLEEIEDSIEHERLGLVFQPTVSLRGDHAERYEVLVRIRNREGLELVPETVFGLAQRHPIGIALDRWVITKALEQLHRRRADDRPLALFVNISCATLQDPSVITWLEQALSEQGVSAEDLVFEIAETSAEQHIGALQRFLEGVKPLGCGFSLDRFGYHSNSLELVNQLQVDYVKLDAHFVYDLMGDSQKQQRLRKVVSDLARQNTIAIASGIENISTLSLLWSCGINYVQGYLLQRPKETLDFDFAAGIP